MIFLELLEMVGDDEDGGAKLQLYHSGPDRAELEIQLYKHNAVFVDGRCRWEASPTGGQEMHANRVTIGMKFDAHEMAAFCEAYLASYRAEYRSRKDGGA